MTPYETRRIKSNSKPTSTSTKTILRKTKTENTWDELLIQANKYTDAYCKQCHIKDQNLKGAIRSGHFIHLLNKQKEN